jgi:hypothetical protein
MVFVWQLLDWFGISYASPVRAFWTTSLSCSYEIHMTMFQLTRRQNEGVKLENKLNVSSQEKQCTTQWNHGAIGVRNHDFSANKYRYILFLTKTGREKIGITPQHRIPFVESSGPFLREHAYGAVDGALVLPLGGVHVPRFDHVHGRRNDSRAEPCNAPNPIAWVTKHPTQLLE